MSASGSAESSDKSENSDRAKKQRTAHTPMDDADLRAACKELVAQANQMNDADLYAACKKLVDQGYPPGVQDTLLMLDGAQKRLEDTETITETLRGRILQMVQREMSVKALKLKPKATSGPKSMPLQLRDGEGPTSAGPQSAPPPPPPPQPTSWLWRPTIVAPVPEKAFPEVVVSKTGVPLKAVPGKGHAPHRGPENYPVIMKAPPGYQPLPTPGVPMQVRVQTGPLTSFTVPVNALKENMPSVPQEDMPLVALEDMPLVPPKATVPVRRAPAFVITAKKSIGTGWHRGLSREQLVIHARHHGLKKYGKALDDHSREEVCYLIATFGEYPRVQGLEEYVNKFGHCET